MKNSRIFYLIFFVSVCFVHVYPQGRWEIVDTPVDKKLRSVFFVDSLYGWAAGDSGTVIHTTDGGTSWTVQNSETENIISDIFFVNRNYGWASSWNTMNFPFGTVILKTTNGGASWQQIPYPDENVFFNCILFIDSLNGWMGGKPQPLVKTTDGGLNWQQANIDSSTLAFLPVLNIKFFDDNYGYACGGAFENAGVIWNTTNGGDMWYAIDPLYAPPDPVHQIHLFDSLNVIGSSGDIEIYGVGMIRTTNGGAFWEYKNVGIQGVAYDLEFRTGYEAWATLGNASQLIYSLDSGNTWTQLPTPDSSIILDIIFPDSLHGYAVGKNGTVIKYIPDIINTVSTKKNLLPEDFILYQNYPNPFNPSTKIKFKIPPFSKGVSERSEDGGLVTLKVFDALGQKVTTLINKELPPGEYEIVFVGKGLTSGVYFYKLDISHLSQTKAMLLIK